MRLRHGVYIAAEAVPEQPAQAHVLRALAEQVAAPGLFAAERTAALAHGLPLLRSDQAAAGATELLTEPTASRRSRRAPARRIGLRSLDAHDLERLPSGLVVTSVARTAADLAVVLPDDEALMVLDAAARLELSGLVGEIRHHHYLDPRLCSAAMRPLYAAVHRVGASLSARARARLDTLLRLTDLRRESPLESYSAAAFRAAGLPRPEHQVRIRTPFGNYYPDNLWAAQRLIGEADGEAKYRDPERVTEEKLRDGYLRDEGYELLHWVGREMFGAPGRVVERAGRLLVARGWDGTPCSW